jgi:hypothetical protein
MARQLQELLTHRAIESFIGRTEQLALLQRALAEDGPAVLHLHGIGGIGKSSLLDAFAARARAEGAAVVRLDCRAIEPTERGFLQALGEATGAAVTTLEGVADRLGGLGERVVLTLDTYEVFRLLDTWLRQAFVPALHEHVRVVLSGREPPVAAWFAAPGWQGVFQSLALGPLTDRDSAELLRRNGLGEAEVARVNRYARGHPLALRLAASAVTTRLGADLEGATAQRVVEELTRVFLADVRDPLTREALDAASVVRRTTLSLLRAMLPDVAPQDAYERLRGLPFVETSADGLVVHDVVQQAIAASLRAADPERYRRYRRAAWRQLGVETRLAGRPELWRYTADTLYILQNPVVRDAFFPTDAHLFAVEPARDSDGPAVRAIIAAHEGPQAGALLEAWWERLPQSFLVARDRHGTIAGFYLMFEPAAVSPASLRADPLAWRWWQHLQAESVAKGERVLFMRRWLDRERGEAPSAVQGPILLDIKRTYMELRPRLRRIYAITSDPSTYGPFLSELGFRTLPQAGTALDGVLYHVRMLDFGPSSVDGWLSRLIDAELGVEDEVLLDREARELLVDGARLSLTRLEFGVLDYLYQREGKAVPRAALLTDVWGYAYEGGSNVVDVVVRSLRKKLGGRARAIETVSGVGYRYRRA